MRTRNVRRRRGHTRRTALDEAVVNLRTAGFLGKRLWRPALRTAGLRARRRTRPHRLRHVR